MDVDRLAELIDELEHGGKPNAEGEEALLLSVASELSAMAPQTQMSQEQEDRIFAKFLDLAPEAAPVIEGELQTVAAALEELAPAAIEESLSEEVADRIFARIQERIPEATAKPSWTATAKLRIAAFAPRPLIQRQADALEALISDARSGRKVQAKGPMADLLTAAMSLQPVPAIEPSPSFVDWLEVRLMSPATEAAPAKTRWSLGEAMRSGRFQTSLAGACAAMVALAVFNLGGDDVVRTPTKPERAPAVAQVTPEDAESGSLSSPAPLVPTVAAPSPSQGSRRFGGGNNPPSGGGGNNNGGNNGGGNNNGGGTNPGEDDGGLSMTASSTGEAMDRIQEFLEGSAGGGQ